MSNPLLDRLDYIFSLRGVVVEDVADLEVEGPVGPDERLAGRAIDQDGLRHRGGAPGRRRRGRERGAAQTLVGEPRCFRIFAFAWPLYVPSVGRRKEEKFSLFN